jgi:uncharacterized lipoprotein
MNQKISRSFEPLERRISLMQQLAGSLTLAQAAVLALDAAALEEHTARQQQLCDQLRALEGAAEPGAPSIVSGSPAAADDGLSPVADQRWNALLQELVRVQADVRHQNRAHAALLARARRSIAILANVLASSGALYSPPNLADSQPAVLEMRK